MDKRKELKEITTHALLNMSEEDRLSVLGNVFGRLLKIDEGESVWGAYLMDDHLNKLGIVVVTGEGAESFVRETGKHCNEEAIENPEVDFTFEERKKPDEKEPR